MNRGSQQAIVHPKNGRGLLSPRGLHAPPYLMRFFFRDVWIRVSLIGSPIYTISERRPTASGRSYREISPTAHATVKEQAYNTYVRPILEYASTVWDPHTKELTSQLEMVQRRAARCVTADYRRRHSVTLMLNQLQWQTLLQRRTHSKVTMLYRIHHQLVAIPATPPYIIYSSTSNRGHHPQLQQHHCRINSYQHSFFPSVVNLWNQLPSDTVGAASLNLFQNRLASLTLC